LRFRLRSVRRFLYLLPGCSLVTVYLVLSGKIPEFQLLLSLLILPAIILSRITRLLCLDLLLQLLSIASRLVMPVSTLWLTNLLNLSRVSTNFASQLFAPLVKPIEP
jgi:hypothetical protein